MSQPDPVAIRSPWYKRRSTLTLVLLLFFAGTYLCSKAHHRGVRIHGAEYRLNGAERVPLQLPLHLRSGVAVADLAFRMELGSDHPVIYYLAVNGCIDGLEINRRSVSELELPVCLWPKGHHIDLSSYLIAGDNDVRFSLRSLRGPLGFSIEPSNFDRIRIVPRLYFVSMVFFLAIFLWFHFAPRGLAWLGVAFCWGTILRILYVVATPTGQREHDYWGHVDYFNYAAHHLVLPHQDLCWSCAHPPLYYVLMAGWQRLVGDMSDLSMVTLPEIQLVALLLSILTLAVGLMIGRVVLPERSQKPWLRLYGLCLAVFPGLLFFSSRINNDVLLQLFAFLFIFSIVLWWKRGKIRDYVLAMVWLSLGLLTKGSIILLYPLVGLLLVLHRTVAWRKKLALLAGSVLLLGAVHGAIQFPRPEERRPFFFRSGPRIMGNIQSVETNVAALTVFHPLRVLERRYNEPGRDGTRREYLWEYLYRSAFVGEFYFGRGLKGLVGQMLLLGMILMATALLGIVRSCSRLSLYDNLPFLLVFMLSLGGIFWFRLQHHYSITQEFRFIPFVVVPCAYYLSFSASLMSARIRAVILLLAYAFVLICSLFFVSIFFKSDALNPANPNFPIQALLGS